MFPIYYKIVEIFFNHNKVNAKLKIEEGYATRRATV